MAAPASSMAIAIALPPPGLSSPENREASVVPAETTKSPEPLPFPKFLQRLPAMSQYSPPAHGEPACSEEAFHGSEVGGQETVGSPGGHVVTLLAGAPEALPLAGPVGWVIPRGMCVTDRPAEGHFELCARAPVQPRRGLLSQGSVWWGPEAFSHVFPCSTEGRRRG